MNSQFTLVTTGCNYWIRHFRSLLALKDVSFPSCHASTIAETPKGIILVDENHEEVGIWFSSHVNGQFPLILLMVFKMKICE